MQTVKAIASNFKTGESFFITAAEGHIEGLKEGFDDQDLFSEVMLDNRDSLSSVLTCLSANMDRMSSSKCMTAMGKSVAALSQQPRPAKLDSHAGNVYHAFQQAKKLKSCDNGSVSDSDDNMSTLINRGQNESTNDTSVTNMPHNWQDSCLCKKH